MDHSKFDELTRQLAEEATRRSLLRAAAGSTIASVLSAGVSAESDAEGRKGKNKKGKGKSDKQGKGSHKKRANAEGKGKQGKAIPCVDDLNRTGKCTLDSQCCSGYCARQLPGNKKGTCAPAPNGYTCKANRFCASGYCQFTAPNTKTGVCATY